MIVDYLAKSYEQPKRESRHTARLERRLHWSLTAQFKFCIKHTVELSRLTVMSYAGLWPSRVAYCDTTFIILEEHIKW